LSEYRQRFMAATANIEALVPEAIVAPTYDYRYYPGLIAALTIFFYTEILIPREIHFAIALIALLGMVIFRTRVIRQAFSQVVPLILVAFWSLILTVALASKVGFEAANIAKTTFYITSAIIYSALGYLVYNIFGSPASIFRAICAVSAIIAVIYIFQYHSDPMIASALAAGNRTYLRHTLGAGTNLWALALAICIAAPALVSRQSVILRLIFFPLIAYALMISTGRTGWAWVAILSFTLLARNTKSTIGYCVIAVLLYTFFVSVLTPIFPMYFGVGSLDWVQQLPTFQESAPVNQSDLPAINTHWRGFETFSAFQFVHMFDAPWDFLGTGLNSLVPIGFNFELGGEERQYLPIFHNGLSFIMVRAGFVGIGLYLWQNIRWIRMFRAPSSDRVLNKANLFGIGLILCLLFSLPTITGLYQQGDCKSIMPFIIGYLIAYRQARIA
jgi:hypothetical protein